MTLSDFDPRSPEVVACPEAYFAAMRSECPVHRDAETGVYSLARYDDVRGAAQRPNLFSSHRPIFGEGDPELEAIQAEGFPEVPTLTPNDPPVHTRYRKLVNRAFSPKVVKDLEPAIKSIISGLIDNFADRGEVEFLSEFAALVPGYVIADALGIDRRDQDKFMHWSDQIVATITFVEGLSRAQQIEHKWGFVQFQHYFAKEIEKRRENPGTDMISDLVTARVGGERPLDRDEILDLIRIFLVAGNETTASWIGGTMRLLLANPEVLAQVTADRSLIPRMLEESLRIISPSRWTTRTVELGAEPVAQVRGVEVPEGSRVRLLWNSANHDEAYYPDPETFDIHREGPGHMAFGHGVHLCIGAALARAEARIAFEGILDRLTGLRLAIPHSEIHNRPMGGVNRLDVLPLTFETI
ncbi:cytochrome P450 [Amycolatopsis alkalitolerans]|nr:cytochrome P450 [Amycolatopsis alkalitolerans]